MPCRYDDYTSGYDNQTRIKSLTYDNDKLTRFLCELCQGIEKGGDIDNILFSNLEITAWWTKHKEEDERRIAKAKQAILAKLTPEERELLGYAR